MKYKLTYFTTMSSKIREPYCAGSWYSNNPKSLASEIDSYLGNVKTEEKRNVKAMIVPHAGYIYSGQVAAYSFRQIGSEIKTVIILGTAHRYPLRGVCIMDYEYYDSPLGKVKVSGKIKDFLKEKDVVSIVEADYGEHSIEIEIPFLQRAMKEFEIIPVIVGQVNHTEFSKLLEEYSDNSTLIVASVDLSHFHDYETAKDLDNYSIDTILKLNAKGIDDAEIDSPYAIKSLIDLALRKEWKTKLLNYKNSGDTAGDKRRVVGYASIIFYN